jgi:hypothetical protein
MRKGFPMLVAVLVLAVSGTAYAYDCLRVSSSPQGLAQSAKSGNWLPFDLGSTEGIQQTFANVFEVELSDDQAGCFATEYADTEAPKYFALGIGVAGGKKETTRSNGKRGDNLGVLAWNNKNYRVLGDGKGIDHIEDSPILSAVFGSLGTCGIAIGLDEEH